MAGGCRAVMNGLHLAVRVTPRAGRDVVCGLDRREGAAPALKVRVAAAPSDGAANDAVVRLVADWFDVPQSRVSIIGGETGRQKLLLVEGDGAALAARCAADLTERTKA
jgi:uncharacterized protein (TIGR00251 family)